MMQSIRSNRSGDPALTRRQAVHCGVLSAAGMMIASRLFAADVGSRQRSETVTDCAGGQGQSGDSDLVGRRTDTHRHL